MDVETTAIPPPTCRRTFHNSMELTREQEDAFFRPKFGSGATSRSGNDAEQRDRQCIVDSGASVHMMSKVDLTPEEQETITVSNKPTTVVAANGTTRTKEQATVYVKRLDMFVTVQFLKDSLAK